VETTDFLFFLSIHTNPGAYPASSTMGTGTPFQEESNQGMELTTQSPLAPNLKMGRPSVTAVAFYGVTYYINFCHINRHLLYR
jgi:hypothetical protein